MIAASTILSKLPPYRDEWRLIKRSQYVPDIMNEISRAHVLFAPYYDHFSYVFYRDQVSEVAEDLNRFIINNISYKAETVRKQTSALPTGILERGYGDCKHYALFAAGVLDSLNRLYGCGYDWCYLFAGYDGADEPYHVFVAVQDDDTELWIDPTPGAGGEPSVLIEQKL